MKKLFSVIFILAVLAGIVPMSSVKAASSDNCIASSEVVQIGYVLMSAPIIPEGAEVEFVSVCGSKDLAMKWMLPLGSGMKVRYYKLGIRVEFERYTKPGSSSSSSWTDPEPGDKGHLIGWFDTQDSEGNWEKDGIADSGLVEQIRIWTRLEEDLMGFSHEYYKDLVANNLIEIGYNSDCLPDEYRISGMTLKPGPWGMTYQITSQGGLLEAVYYHKGTCSWFKEETVRWSLSVVPGDYVGGTEEFGKVSLSEGDPWGFCHTLGYQRPQWQSSEDFIPGSVQDACPDLHSKSEESWEATLSRMGFHRSIGGSVGPNYRTYMWWGEGRTSLDAILFEGTWVETPNMLDAKYSVQIHPAFVDGFMLSSKDEAAYSYTEWIGFGSVIGVINEYWLDSDVDFNHFNFYRVVLKNDKPVIEVLVRNTK